jgi:hypothetical protein
MKQGLSRRYGYDAALVPMRGSLRWLWFAAARPIAMFWTADPEPLRRRRREPKPAVFAH